MRASTTDSSITPSRRRGTVTRLGIPVVAALATVSCAAPAPPRDLDELERSGTVVVDPETGAPYSGPVFSTKPAAVGPPRVAAGLAQQLVDRLAPRRAVTSVERYVEGVREGPYEWYSETGNIFETGSYREGTLDGPYEAFWDDSGLYERGAYRSGRFHGERSWYLDGILVERATYVAGTIDGPYLRYTDDGDVVLRGALDDGVPCGPWFNRGVRVEHPPCGGRTGQ